MASGNSWGRPLSDGHAKRTAFAPSPKYLCTASTTTLSNFTAATEMSSRFISSRERPDGDIASSHEYASAGQASSRLMATSCTSNGYASPRSVWRRRIVRIAKSSRGRSPLVTLSSRPSIRPVPAARSSMESSAISTVSANSSEVAIASQDSCCSSSRTADETSATSSKISSSS